MRQDSSRERFLDEMDVRVALGLRGARREAEPSRSGQRGATQTLAAPPKAATQAERSSRIWSRARASETNRDRSPATSHEPTHQSWPPALCRAAPSVARCSPSSSPRRGFIAGAARLEVLHIASSRTATTRRSTASPASATSRSPRWREQATALIPAIGRSSLKIIRAQTTMAEGA